ncbi:MAG: ester cyclase [Dehalococcoidia bacterium]
MTVEATLALIRRQVAAYNAHDLTSLATMYAPEFRRNGEVIGVDGYLRGVVALHSAFPDLVVTVADQVATDDTVWSRLLHHATHQGDYHSPVLGRVAPTGRPVFWSGIALYRVAAGRFTELWANGDEPGILRCLGALPTRHASSDS